MDLAKTAKRALVAVVKVLVAAVVFLGTVYGYSYYRQLPVREFCDDLPTSMAPQDVVSMAKSMGLPVVDVIDTRGVVVVLNQKSPFFRFACEIEYINNVQVGRSILSAD